MNDVEKAVQTQLKNIETRSGKSLDELSAIVRRSGLEKHGEIRDMLKRELGLGHGDANTLTHYALQSRGAGATGADAIVDELYAGAKAALRPIHEKLMAAIHGFGEFEISPKKTYLSLRRKKQFAMIGPATSTRVEVGLNMKDVPGGERLVQLPAGGMCQYKVKVASAQEVDKELLGWIKQAYDSAG
jgi:Domain of unknown function (DUF5655)/Domain of unknown function (DUF4287)